jgi:HAD superfamily hydrolase (TIGR01509 family)
MPTPPAAAVQAVVFDLDGLLLDSEPAWDEARRQVTAQRGGRWTSQATLDMMGMSSPEWSRYMHQRLGVPLDPQEIAARVVERMQSLYRRRLPLVHGARPAVERLARRWPLAMASSSNRPVIDLALSLAGLEPFFQATVSSEEVARGKPAPDVYLEAARRLGIDPSSCAAIEDSRSGILSASAAGMRVIAVPNQAFPPGDEALEAADKIVGSLAELTEAVVADVAGGRR